MAYFVTGSFFYLAWGAILWLGQSDDAIDDWDRQAVDNFVNRMRPGDALPGRQARIVGQLLVSMVMWPTMKWRSR